MSKFAFQPFDDIKYFSAFKLESFSVVKRKARTAKNPRTGKAVKVPAKKVAKFKAGSKLLK